MRNNHLIKINSLLLIATLFIFSAITPIVFGYNSRISDQENPISSSSSDGPPMDSPWPMFQHDTKHTGRSPYGVDGTPGVEKWKFWVDGLVHSSPAIDNDGIIYIGTHDFYALYPNGTLKWKYNTNGGVESSPAIDEDGTIYVGTAHSSFNDYFYALYPNGTLKWRYLVDNIFSSPVIGTDGTIYFGDSDNYIKALYPNGTLRWKYETTDDVRKSPAIDDDGTIYCGSSDHYLYALYPNGTLKWKYNAGCRIGGDPTIGDDNTIYFGGVEEGALYALYSNGTRKWKLTLGSNVVSSPALAEDGTIYIAAYKAGPKGAYIYSINPDGPSINWRYEVEDEAMSASPAIDKYGTVYIGGWGGYEWGGFYALNPDGTLRWTYKTKDAIFSSAAIGEDGTIYVGSWDEYLYAIEVLDNQAPETPILNGPTNGEILKKYTYIAQSSDSDGDNISYFFDWGDGRNSDWTEFVPSGTSRSRSHTWLKEGTYTVSVKAKDTYGAESDWGTLTVTMPRDRHLINTLFLRLLERFPNAFPLLRQLIGL